MNKKYLLHLIAIIMVTVLNVSLLSCGSDNDDDDIDITPISLIAGDDKTIQGADTISSSNRFVAYGKGNVVHGWHVGEASLVVNGKKRVPIKVLPKYHLYDDPICNWGCDINYVKANQKQGVLSGKSTNTLLAYENAGAASILSYTFENGKLKSILAIVSTNHASQYGSYLAERYLMLPYYEGENTYFIGANGTDLDNATTAVIMQVYSISQLVTLYLPAQDYSTRTSRGQIDIEKIAKEYINQFFMYL